VTYFLNKDFKQSLEINEKFLGISDDKIMKGFAFNNLAINYDLQ